MLPSAADFLPFPFGALAQTPQLTLVLAGGGYLVFLVLFLPLYLLSFIVTVGGAWAALVSAVYLGGRGLTHAMSYPGASRQVQREMEREYSKNVGNRLISFGKSLRLWLQLVRNTSVVPSGMTHFRALHDDIHYRGIAPGGDVSVLARALEELICAEHAPIDTTGRRFMGFRWGIGGGGPAVKEELTASAIGEASVLLESLTGVLAALEDVLASGESLASCESTFDFDKAREALLAPAVLGGPPNSFVFMLTLLEGLVVELMRIASDLKPRREGRGEEGGDGGESGREESYGFPGSLVRSWWSARSPYQGAAGFGLMRGEMLIKSNAQQVWLTMSDGTQLDCCYCHARPQGVAAGR
ncbi:unnamed protein product, partial [Choristocarpus tenellus]